MIELYKEVFSKVATEERTETVVEVVSVLYDLGYSDELDVIVDLVSVAEYPEEIIGPLELAITTTCQDLLDKLGVSISKENIYQNLRDINLLLSTILTDIESYEDIDGMISILDADEPNNITLVELTLFISSRQMTSLYEIIEEVSDRLIEVIRGTLEVRLSDDGDDSVVDLSTAMKVEIVMTRYPNSPAFDLLDNNGFMEPVSKLIQDATLNPDETENYLEMTALLCAAILFVKYQEGAEEEIEDVCRLILDDRCLESLLQVCDTTRALLLELQSEYEDIINEVD